jgi:glycosyltransferase involved in cell wall biosynthesis
MSKIKVFLGGYINYTNAQNLNCRAVAEYLDKDKFEVLALTTHFGKREHFEINTFNCFRPFSLSKHLGFLWGILNCDAAYLPKHIDTPLWVLKLSKLFKKPIFTTIEGNVTDLNKPNLIDLFGSEHKMKNHFNHFNQVFGITHFLVQATKSALFMQNFPLFLGVNGSQFSPKIKNKLNSIVFVGGLINRKRVDEFLQLAKHYSQITFSVIGAGPEKKKLVKKAGSNVIFHGVLTHSEMSALFHQSDLMFLPAKSEGFPKVILEAAASGIPSIVYNTYVASDWMTHRMNGFIVNNFNDVKVVVDELLSDSKLLQSVSENAMELANDFDWKKIIKDWEKVIVNLNNGK